MKVAEISITFGSSGLGSMAATAVGFDDAAKAESEFERLKSLLDSREKRSNDLEKIVTISGLNSFACPLREIVGIGYADFASLNVQEAGVRDAFPNLFKK